MPDPSELAQAIAEKEAEIAARHAALDREHAQIAAVWENDLRARGLSEEEIAEMKRRIQRSPAVVLSRAARVEPLHRELHKLRVEHQQQVRAALKPKESSGGD